MPSGTPFRTLPYGEILDRLRSLTNLRVVPDEKSDTGYRVEIGPFTGWKAMPTWSGLTRDGEGRGSSIGCLKMIPLCHVLPLRDMIHVAAKRNGAFHN